MREKPIRVLLVDDQVLMRRGLRKVLEVEDGIEVVGEAADGVEALRIIPETRPEVALVDARMPKMDGVELIRRLSEEHPRVAAIVLTTFDDDEYVFGGLRAGARSYLLKDTPPEELVSAIEKTSRDETVLGARSPPASSPSCAGRGTRPSASRAPETRSSPNGRWRSPSSWARAPPTVR
jgi:DNA-binding NarL/FixJ family response regulator